MVARVDELPRRLIIRLFSFPVRFNPKKKKRSIQIEEALGDRLATKPCRPFACVLLAILPIKLTRKRRDHF